MGRRGDDIRRQEAQSDKESKMAFFKGAYGIHRHRKERKAHFFPHLSIFHTYSTCTFLLGNMGEEEQRGTEGEIEKEIPEL